MQNPTIRIIAAVVNTTHLTLYKEDGETIVIPQGDPRLRRILDDAVPSFIERGYADITLNELVEENSYHQFEKESSGLVKFFKIAKSKLKNLFTDTGPVPEQAYGQVDSVTKLVNAIAEIMQHATPVASPDFHEMGIAKQGNVVEDTGHTSTQKSEPTDAPNTIIAVVNNQVIPNMERIKTQFDHSAKLGSTVGVETFLKRIAAVMDKRSHSVEDLLKFMERGDLPIADDGSIVVYKVLRYCGKDTYVDCHTKKVEQQVGDYVCMDESLVDPVRNNECSNGLHVARRGYIRSFDGDVCVLAKVAPEDVITVPSYDANKMRVCGYHIVAVLSQNEYDLVKANKPITETVQGRVLLSNVLAGKHIHKVCEVRITRQRGEGVVRTHFGTPFTYAPTSEQKLQNILKHVEQVALENPDKQLTDTPVKPADVIKQVEALKAPRKEEAARLYKEFENGVEGAVEALREFKRTAKVSWAVLGFTREQEDQIKAG